MSNNHQDDLNGGSMDGRAKAGSDPGSATNSQGGDFQGVNQRWALGVTGKGNAIRDEKGVKVFLTSSEDWLLTGNPSHRPSPPKGYCADHTRHIWRTGLTLLTVTVISCLEGSRGLQVAAQGPIATVAVVEATVDVHRVLGVGRGWQ